MITEAKRLRAAQYGVEGRLLEAFMRAGAEFELDAAGELLVNGVRWRLGPRVEDWRTVDTAARDIVAGAAPREICLYDKESGQEWQLSLLAAR